MRSNKITSLAGAAMLIAGFASAQDTYFPGVLRDERWVNNGTSPSVAGVLGGSITPFSAGYTYSDALDLNQSAKIPFNSGINNFVIKMSGVFVAPATTNYVFWVCSDDDSQLYLSTDATPFNKRLVAQESGWSNSGQWNASSGGSKVSNKHSDTFIPSGSTFPPFAAGIKMTAGSKYYFEYIGHQGGGGENFWMTYTYLGQPTPTGNKTAITNDTVNTPNFGVYIHPPTFMTLSGLSNRVAYSGRQVAFNIKLSTDETPYPATYNWYGSNQFTAGTFVQIPGATTPVLTVKPGRSDNNSAVYCIVGFTNTDGALLPSFANTATSAIATLTVLPDNQSLLVQGGLKKEFFNQSSVGFASRAQLENGISAGPGATDLGNIAGPTSVTFVQGSIDPVINNGINNFVQRISGFFTPTNTDNYNFYVSSDDDTDLFLSTDDNPSNKRLIAQETGWSNTRQWAVANSGPSGPKNSATWSPDGGTTVPYASGISLVAGQAYYIEAITHQGGGGENFGFTVASATGVQPVNNDPSNVDPSQLSFLTSPATSLAITQNPANQSAFTGDNVVFKANASTDSEITPLFQWLQNGTNLAGATGTQLSLSSLVIGQNGNTYQFTASVPGTSLRATSTVATLTVRASITVSNYLKKEFWGTNGSISRANVEAGTAGLPDYTAGIPLFFAGNAGYLNYAQRVSGFFIPPQTTNYLFWIEADDDADLFLSTDSTVANKRQIAAEVGWSNQGQWNSSSSGNSVSQKASVSYLPAGASVPPYAAGIPLTAGTPYYIEAVMHQGGGGERLEVTFATVWENSTYGIPFDGDATRIDGAYTGPYTVDAGYAGPAGIAFLAPQANYVAFTQQPVGGTTNVGSTFTMSVAGVSDATVFFQPGAAPNQAIPTQNVTYQWLSNNVPIIGANGSSYSTATLLPSNDGDVYTVALKALGYVGSSNSQPAVIHINPDHTAPVLTNASFAYADQYGNYKVTVSFSKTIGSSLTNAANYSVTGQTVLGVNYVSPTQAEVLLSGFPSGNSFTLNVSNIRDLAGNVIASGSHITANQFTALTSVDIDPTIQNPGLPGDFFPLSTNTFIITGGGSDIWDANDGFRYTYLQKTGDFDVAVNVQSITTVNTYSKAGLMIREDLTSYSRQWDIVTEGLATTPAIDGGFGSGGVEGDCRDTSGAATDANWGSSLAPYHPGDYPPQYPNQWLRIARVGENFYGYQSYDGVTWVMTMADSPTNRGSATPFPATTYVGMAVTAHHNTTSEPKYLNTSVFASFQDTSTLPVPVTPATITATHVGSNIHVSWTPAGGRLQSATTLKSSGTVWTDVGTTNPTDIPASSDVKYFRVVNP